MMDFIINLTKDIMQSSYISVVLGNFVFALMAYSKYKEKLKKDIIDENLYLLFLIYLILGATPLINKVLLLITLFVCIIFFIYMISSIGKTMLKKTLARR